VALPAIAAPVRFVAHREAFLAIDLPAAAQQDDEGRYAVRLGQRAASFDLTWSTPHVNTRTVDCSGGVPTYRVSKPTLFAYSCNADGIVTYHAEKYGRTYRVGASDATETVELNMTYPADQRAFWDPIVTHMSRTLRVQAQKR
jgi:hypothetical protein